jgi:hypothetical protein
MAKKKTGLKKVKFSAAKIRPKKPRSGPPRPHGAWRAYVGGYRPSNAPLPD